MPHARNASPEDKAHAVLALAEYCVRPDVAPNDLSDSDRLFMNQSADILCQDLNVLRQQAQAQSTNAWRNTLDSAHSMRCVTIDRDRKDEKRQCIFRCDGCGRQEKWCGLAIDLAGRGSGQGGQPNDWLNIHGLPSVRWPALFSDFHTGYQKDTGEPERCDMGRFYLGKTCHRKAQLCFIANTLVQETLYNAKQLVHEQWNNGAEFREDELYTVDDEAPQEFIDRKDQLELCIADEKRGDTPDVMVDGRFWDGIDEARLELTDDEIRSKATLALNRMGGESASPAGEDQMSDDDDDEFVPAGDDAEEEDDEFDGVEDDAKSATSRARGKRPVFRPAVDDWDGRSHAAPPKKRRHAVIDDEDDDEPAPARAKPPRRRSRRVQQLSPDGEVAAATAQAQPAVPAEEEDESDEDVLVSSLAHPKERRSAPPSAIEVARNMRIPREGVQQLGSRQAVLLGLINVQKDLILKRESGLAAQVGAAVLTIQELIEVAERSRVGQ